MVQSGGVLGLENPHGTEHVRAPGLDHGFLVGGAHIRHGCAADPVSPLGHLLQPTSDQARLPAGIRRHEECRADEHRSERSRQGPLLETDRDGERD